MNLKPLRQGILVLIFVASTSSIFFYLLGLMSPKFDLVSTCTYIVDGDTFDIANGERIRLADVDTPERGEYGYIEAFNALSNLIYEETVYLDIDDIYRTGPYGRLICVVYIAYNSTHYVNVNEALLMTDLARISNYPNEFDPYTWPLFVSETSLETRIRIAGISMIPSLIIVLFLNWVIKRIWRTSDSTYQKIVRPKDEEIE